MVNTSVRYQEIPKTDEAKQLYEAELARVRREHAEAQDYADLERRVMANDAAYVAALERAYPHLKGEE